MNRSERLHTGLDYKSTPLWNESLSLEERLDYLIQNLTLEEKIQCLTINAPGIERLGIKPFSLGGEAAHGVEARHDQNFNKGLPVNTTVFTQPIGMSATWDPELIEKAGMVVGTEARAIFRSEQNMGLVRWAPTVDMERDPRWGRTEEGYGEDPYLTGKMSSAYIRGIQGDDSTYIRCAATLKHFYANNEEMGRENSSSSLDPRNKHEYYLEPFRRTITEANVEAVMTSYNEINGIPAIVDNEIQDILKDQYGLKGHVVCDMRDMEQTVTKHKYYETHGQTLASALEAGIDSFNDDDEVVIAAAHEALEKGLITEDEINRSIRNTFSTKLRLGLYDSRNLCPYSIIDEEQLNCKEFQEISLEVAKKSVILLKNENQLLPFNKATREKIAVVGPLASVWNKDWYCGIPRTSVTPSEGIRSEFPNADLSYAEGLDHVKVRIGSQYLALKEDGSCYLSTETDAEVFEHTDWGDNKHTLRSVRTNKFLELDPDTGVIIAKKEEVFSWFVQEVFSFHKVGKVDDAGSFTIKCWNHRPLHKNSEGKLVSADERDSGNGSLFSIEIITNGLEQAVDLACKSDKVIAVMGCHPIISSKEGVDRHNLLLPPLQSKLIKEIRRVNPNVILVFITNYPYSIDWEQENLPAILITASGSQDLGTAIAKAISGEYSPSGRLNMTWYPGSEKLPPMREYDIIHGKRTYQYYQGNTLYPFGYGLTYTKFEYHDMKVLMEANYLSIRLVVDNVGAYDSDEVVQLYISQLHSRTIRPIRQLKGFQRTMIGAGEKAEIVYTLPYEELRYYDVVTGSMILEDDDYLIQIGASSQDIRLQEKAHIKGIRIPPRDMSQPILCDHYDTYSNIYLHRGHDDEPCIMPKESTDEKSNGVAVSGYTVYNDSRFSFIPRKIVFDMKAEEQGRIQVWFGEKILIDNPVNIMDEFKEIEVSIEIPDFDIGDTKPLKIAIQGRIRIVQFSFQ